MPKPISVVLEKRSWTCCDNYKELLEFLKPLEVHSRITIEIHKTEPYSDYVVTVTYPNEQQTLF